MAENEVDLDSIIDRLLEVRGSRPGKQVQLLEQEIRFLCTKAREIFISQPILLELEAPIKVRDSVMFLRAHPGAQGRRHKNTQKETMTEHWTSRIENSPPYDISGLWRLRAVTSHKSINFTIY